MPDLSSKPGGPPARVADLVGRTLRAHGIRHAFGMPGGEVVTLIDGLAKAGIDFTLARHETPAAIMAAGAYRATGAPALLVTTLGPGLANGFNGIADAVQEQVPLLVMSGVVERSLRGRYTHQVVDHAALLRPLVKASFEIEAESAAATTARALAMARIRPFGPVHLDLSPQVAALNAVEQELWEPCRGVSPSIDLSGPDLASLADLLIGARSPLVVAGTDAAAAAIGDPLRRLLEKLGAPLLTTYRAKGVVDERHPLVLGAAGLSPLADRELLPLVRAADVILLVGFDPIEMRQGWLDAFSKTSKVVELTPWPFDHAMHQVDLRLIGQPAELLTGLGMFLGAPGTRAMPENALAVADRLADAFAAPPDGFGAHQVAEALDAALSPDTTMTVDSGAHRILLSQKLHLSRPGQLLQSTGWCTMGAALPLAIGLKKAAPERHVIAVMGDGGLEMVAGELATLRDLALPVTVVVLQDASLALIALKQSQAGLPSLGVDLPRSDFATLAAAFGGDGVLVEDRAALDQALKNARESGRFTLIACRTEADDYVGKI